MVYQLCIDEIELNYFIPIAPIIEIYLNLIISMSLL